MESTSSNQQGEALELITYNVETGKFHVGQRALAILRDIRTPLSVVAVCGRCAEQQLLDLHVLHSAMAIGSMLCMLLYPFETVQQQSGVSPAWKLTQQLHW